MSNSSDREMTSSLQAKYTERAEPHVKSLDNTPGSATKHPPRASLVLRVGVVGHRPDPKKRAAPDIAALREICRKLLIHIKDTFAGVAITHRDLFGDLSAKHEGDLPTGLRIISALADGGDQWVADEATRLGYELQVVLPFQRNEYENDFDSNVLIEHRRLRGLATAVFELDGCRALSDASYLAAGRVVLNQSDLLIAIWDGKDSQGVAGTGQIVNEALRRGIPTLWVNWTLPSDWHIIRPAWRLLRQPIDLQGDLRLLTDEVTELLLSPDGNHNSNNRSVRDVREQYFSEPLRSWTLLGRAWDFFRETARGKLPSLRIRVPTFICATRMEWRREWEGRDDDEREHRLPDSAIDWVEKCYLPHYSWANGLSMYYGNNYRGSFISIYVLGALAVFLALFTQAVQGPMAHAANDPPVSLLDIVCIAVEFVVILSIISLTWYGRHRRWHERWIDYRMMAEQLRVDGFTSVLGGVWNKVNVPPHFATYGDPAATWMHWHARAVQRSAGLPNNTVNAEYLSGLKGLLLEVLISGQRNYHDENSKRLGSVDHSLRFFGESLFITTLAVCLVHFSIVIIARHEALGGWDRWLTFGAAFLPALGAALAAIRSQGEFHRVAQRSRGMCEELEQLRQTVANLPARPNELNSQLLQKAVEQTTRLMYSEVLDWRIVFQDRPLVWPA